MLQSYAICSCSGRALAGVVISGPISARCRPRNWKKDGGSMTITYKNEMASLDPAIGYDPASWNLIRALFDGLMGYELGTTNLRTNLAESVTVSPDGLTYIFKLRSGVTFHNGRALTAEDARYAIDRVIDPKTKSPGQQFFAAIVGFADRASGKSDRLAGVRAVDNQTVEIKLTHPDASFLHIMAINFSFPVPREEVEKAAGDFGKHPVGTGAFKLQEWRPGQQIVLVRNPAYFRKGLPHLDTVIVSVGVEPLTAMLQFEKGEVDVLGDGIPPAKFTEVTKDPQYQGQHRQRQPPADHLPYDEDQSEAVRRQARSSGRELRDQQGPHRPVNQWSGGCHQPNPAARAPRLREGLQGLRLRSEQGAGAAGAGGLPEWLLDRAFRHQHRPRSAHRSSDATGSRGRRDQD